MQPHRRLQFASLLIVLLAMLYPRELTGQNDPFDILILNGRVIDGTGNPWSRRDIGVRAGEIAAVGDLRDGTARRTIDARGMYVVPGFIDLHSHADRALGSEHSEPRHAASHITQGLTTVVGAADGRNLKWPLEEEIDSYEKQGIAMNVVLMVGHNSVREAVMGQDYERAAIHEEIDRMQDLVRQAMGEGAWGLGAGLEYRPGRFSSPEEVVALARAAAEYDGFYIAHQRSEAVMPRWQLPSLMNDWPIDGLQGLQETINIARATGIRVVASHQKARGRSSFGRSAYDTIVVNKARDEGLEVYLDVYPYETFGGGPRSMMPQWALVDPGVDVSGGRDAPIFGSHASACRVQCEEGIFDKARENLRKRWSDPRTRALIERDIAWIVDHDGGPDRVLVVDYSESSYVGKTLAELAAERGKTYEEIVVEMALNGYEDVPWGAWFRGFGIHEVDVENYIKHDYTATSSDAQVSGIEGIEGFEGRPGSHPRHFGAFVRKIAHYVKDRHVISLPFAIRSQTGLPAQIIGLPDRGFLREGYKADIVIFNYERLRDRATVLEPQLQSEGVVYVLVNGEFTVDEGRVTQALPGVVIRRR